MNWIIYQSCLVVFGVPITKQGSNEVREEGAMAIRRGSGLCYWDRPAFGLLGRTGLWVIGVGKGLGYWGCRKQDAFF